MKHPSLRNLVSPPSDADGEELPAEFRAALDALASARPPAGILLQDTPAPARLAPFARAMAARIEESGPDGADVEIGVARFIVLHDPAGHDAWKGTTRIVGYVSVVADDGPAEESAYSDEVWDWLTEALDGAGAAHHTTGGTVSRTISNRYGELAAAEPSLDLEIRASWTAEGPELDRHLTAWLDLFGRVAGLPSTG